MSGIALSFDFGYNNWLVSFRHKISWKIKWNARSKLFYCIIFRCSMLWWSSRTLTKKSQSQKCFNERKYQYLKYKKKNHSGPNTYKLSNINLAPNLNLSVVQNMRGLDFGFWEILKPLKWTNITSFFLIKNGCKDITKNLFLCEFK